MATTQLISRGELKPYKGDFYLWKYVPSMPAAVIFIVIFLGLSIAHTWKMWTKRMWFCLPFVIGGYLEVIGFAGRAAASNATDQLGPYVTQSFFTLVPPSLFAASIYMTLGRIIRGLGPSAESLSLVKVRWLTTLFVVGDVFSFLIQSTGAGMSATGKNQKLGENVVVGGLVIQIVFFGLFVASAVVFHVRYSRFSYSSMVHGSSRSSAGAAFGWQGMLNMLYATSALILVRCLFRIVEYVMGADAYPLSNEWMLYVFDALLMSITMAIFYWWYPSQIQQSKELRSGSSIGMMERSEGMGSHGDA